MKDDLVTRDEGFRLITRALALLCFITVIGSLLFLPTDALGLLHHVQYLRLAREIGHSVEEEIYWIRYYASLTCARLAATAIDLWFALWLYRGAAGARKFFLPDELTLTEQSDSVTSQ